MNMASRNSVDSMLSLNILRNAYFLLTAPKSCLPCTMSTNCWAISSATRVCASVVEAPRWGVTVTLGWFNSAEFLGGSCQHCSNTRVNANCLHVKQIPKSNLEYLFYTCRKTSSAAPPHLPLSNARSTASSSTTPPRATLMTRRPFLHLLNMSSPIISANEQNVRLDQCQQCMRMWLILHGFLLDSLLVGGISGTWTVT